MADYIWTPGKPPMGWPLDPSSPLAAGLVGLYAINEGAGLPSDAVTGAGATGGGATWAASPYGPALSFDGTSQQITLNDPTLAARSGPLTIACLAAPDASATNQHLIDVRRTTSPQGGYFVSFSFGTPGTIGYFVQGTGSSTTANSSSGVIDGGWHAWGVSHSSTSAGGVAFYRDGQPIGTATASIFPAVATSPNIATIGSNGTGGALFNGGIALIAIASRAWSADEHAAFAANPWQLFLPRRRRVFRMPIALTLDASPGSYSVSGSPAELTLARILDAGTGSIAVTGSPADIEVTADDFEYIQGTGSTATGLTISATFGSPVTVGNLIVVCVDSQSSASVLTCSDSEGNGPGGQYNQAVVKSGWGSGGTQQLAIFWAVTSAGGSGLTVTVTGTNSAAMTLSIDEFRPLVAGTIALDGTPATGNGTSGLSLSTAPISLAGSRSLVVAVGRVQQNLSLSYDFTAGTGYTLTYTQRGAGGVNDQATEYLLGASGTVTPTLTAGTGSASFWGMAAAAFRVSTSVNLVLNASPGVFAIAGAPANLSLGRSLAASAGSFGVSGRPAGISVGRVLEAQAGSYAVTGSSAGISLGRTLDASPGSVDVAGESAAILIGRVLEASAGSFDVTGFAATIVITVGPAWPVGYWQAVEVVDATGEAGSYQGVEIIDTADAYESFQGVEIL